VDLRGALKSKIKNHYPAIIEPKPFSQLLIAIDHYQGTNTVKNALKLVPMLMLRPGELRQMKWSNVNWEKQQLEYSELEMKTKGRPHIVPLADQAYGILQEQQMFSGNSNFVFPSARGARRPLSDNGMRSALLTMGFESSIHTVHGFRTSPRTMMDEVLHIEPHLLEHQLHHLVKDPNGRAYNRTSHLEARKKMLQSWADYLDKIKVKKWN
jgi:integrase